ncbi:MAG TPA: hypothetical protein VN420_00085 [Candidatus Fimivivens sp.]|nr:hypothetical protein [Candidatus Fimivivens sp.]
MTSILSLFYLVMFCGIAAIGLFICYHVIRYSLSRQSGILTVLVFSSVFLFFLSANAIAFFRVDWNGLLRNLGTPSTSAMYLRY